MACHACGADTAPADAHCMGCGAAQGPAVTGMTPATGRAGTVVEIRGFRLHPNTEVAFEQGAATSVSAVVLPGANPTLVRVEVPVLTAGDHKVVVMTTTTPVVRSRERDFTVTVPMSKGRKVLAGLLTVAAVVVVIWGGHALWKWLTPASTPTPPVVAGGTTPVTTPPITTATTPAPAPDPLANPPAGWTVLGGTIVLGGRTYTANGGVVEIPQSAGVSLAFADAPTGNVAGTIWCPSPAPWRLEFGTNNPGLLHQFHVGRCLVHQ